MRGIGTRARAKPKSAFHALLGCVYLASIRRRCERLMVLGVTSVATPWRSRQQSGLAFAASRRRWSSLSWRRPAARGGFNSPRRGNQRSCLLSVDRADERGEEELKPEGIGHHARWSGRSAVGVSYRNLIEYSDSPRGSWWGQATFEEQLVVASHASTSLRRFSLHSLTAMRS